MFFHSFVNNGRLIHIGYCNASVITCSNKNAKCFYSSWSPFDIVFAWYLYWIHTVPYFSELFSRRKSEQMGAAHKCIRYGVKSHLSPIPGDVWDSLNLISKWSLVLSGKKFVTLIFVIFLGTPNYNYKTFRFPGGCCKVLYLL